MYFLGQPDLYSLPNVQVVRSRGIRLAGHIWEKRVTYNVLVGKLIERDHLEKLGMDRRVILK